MAQLPGILVGLQAARTVAERARDLLAGLYPDQFEGAYQRISDTLNERLAGRLSETQIESITDQVAGVLGVNKEELKLKLIQEERKLKKQEGEERKKKRKEDERDFDNRPKKKQDFEKVTLKYIERYISNTPFENFGDAIKVCINESERGETIHKRLTNHIKMRSLRLRMFIQPERVISPSTSGPPMGDYGRIVVVYDKQSNGKDLDADEIFLTRAQDGELHFDGLSFPDILKMDRFKIIKDHLLFLPSYEYDGHSPFWDTPNYDKIKCQNIETDGKNHILDWYIELNCLDAIYEERKTVQDVLVPLTGALWVMWWCEHFPQKYVVQRMISRILYEEKR